MIAATRAAAHETGVETVSIPNADDHNACATSPWTYGFNSPLNSDAPEIGLVATSYHPNIEGMTAVASQLAHALAR
ncbi:hypothetical protein [Nocardia bhagyanarayanae]|uniref:hypothetical protein n=1 Tax=Nocardia bhagyanarayanae TaxID=1215925 RepID=UPI00114DB8C2|nr:hypothetical protein [Nocardia bhagyanarayanae]